MARSDPQVNIRMPSELKTLLESAAAGTKRSLNAEILTRLFDTFYEGEPGDVTALRATVEQQADLIRR